jgi:hypothetical protein
VAGGYDYTAMIRDLVLSDELADAEVEPLQVRPEALDRLLSELTGGHRWREELPSFGEVLPLVTSLHGVRDIAGGGDHDHVLHPNFSPAPTVLLALDGVARHAAEAAVANGAIDATLVDEAEVRTQLVQLLPRATGRLVADDDPLVDELVALFQAGLELHDDDPAQAWRVALRGLFLDPDLVTY